MSTTNDPITRPRQYNNHVIRLEPNWEFTVTGPEFFDESQYSIHFKSLVDAQNEIDKRIESAKKIEAKNIQLNVELLNGKGEVFTVKSINRNTGYINFDSKFVYPNIPWIKEALLRLAAISCEQNFILESLSQVRIESQRSYGRIDADNYPQKILQLTKQIEEKTAKAHELAITKLSPLSEAVNEK